MRKGVFIGFYGPPELKKELQQRAKAEHRTLSAEVEMRLKRSLQQEAPKAGQRVEQPARVLPDGGN